MNEVFTPRNSSVNTSMYIDRGTHERALYRSVTGTMHSFLFGESGSGKTWLYKKVFADHNVVYLSVNAANVSRGGSLVDELYRRCFKDLKAQKVGYKETKKAGFSAIGTAELSHEAEFVLEEKDKLYEVYKYLYSKSNKKGATIVLDNIETMFESHKLMSELTDVLILLDDDDYAGFKVKFLLIAVPNNVLQYFSHAKNPTSVGNRVNELARVAGLNAKQVQDFIERGFVNSLRVSIEDVDRKKLAKHIYTVTLGIPQRMHEYCECLAYRVEDNDWSYNDGLMDLADFDWLQKGLRECYSIIEWYLNSDETTDGRRNQVIYALGRISTHQIDASKIGAVISQDFPSCAPSSNSGIGQVLGYISKGDKPILKKLLNSTLYSFQDPRYLMCIRLMLYIEPITEKVKKKTFTLN
ncbi:AAA family ATPase [Cobetia sp. 5-11-6-3]|uniref:AAA family ATPase n=1 Tax=Cobetia sp. 5-11-6-3 TaxID=2737458 RepID=UPI00159696FB|nr:AAA family ATPase [Cobetia sp. 5-11-6-3]